MKVSINNTSYKFLIWACVLLLISEATVQIQYLFLGRQVFNIIYVIYLLILISIVLSFSTMIKTKTIYYNVKSTNYFGFFMIVSILSIIINLIKMDFPINYYIISYIGLFMPLYIIFFILINNRNLSIIKNNNDYIFKLLTILAIIFIGFGMLQYIKNDTIVPVVDSNGNELVHVYLTATKMRIFSLFQYPGTYGFIIAYMTTLWMSKMKFIDGKRKTIKKILLFILCLLGAFSVYKSGIRTNLIILALSISAIYLVKYVKSNKLIITLSLLFAFCMFLYYLKSYNSGLNNYTSLNSNATLITRFNIWIKLLNQYTFNGDLSNLLFGNAITSNAAFGLNDPIDNFYVSVLLYNGVLGLISWVSLNLYLWNLCLKKAKYTKNIFWVSASAMYFALPTVFITSTLTVYPLVLVFAFLQKDKTKLVSSQ